MTRTDKGWTMFCPYESAEYHGEIVHLSPEGQCEHAGKCRGEIPCAWDDTEPEESSPHPSIQPLSP